MTWVRDVADQGLTLTLRALYEENEGLIFSFFSSCCCDSVSLSVSVSVSGSVVI